MTKIRSTLAASCLIMLGAGAASAADLYNSGPRISMKDGEAQAPYRACSGDRFAGFYAGATAGGTQARYSWEETFADFSPDYQDSPLKVTKSGFTAGGTLGYNMVRCNTLLGLEGDFNLNNISSSTNHFPNQPQFAGAGSATINDSMKNFATLRARMGFVADRTLFFATAGFAWADLKHEMLDNNHFDAGTDDQRFSGWKAGWTVGGGMEHALTQSISLKAEALYMDFGRQDYSRNDSANVALLVPDVYNFSHHTSAVTARVGINFKLGGGSRGCDHDCNSSPMK